MTRWVAGLDGCRGAWAGALIDLDDPARWRCGLFPRIVDVLDGPEAPVCAGIDVPIGLPDRVSGGGRAADQAARAFLGAGRASVFPVPPRAAVYAASYDEAKALSRAGSEPPFAPSIQCWNILRYVREADDVLRARPDLAARLHEVHPEVAFFRLNGERRLTAGKKGPARAEGLSARRALLIAAGLPEALVGSAPPPGVGADDHLDAMAALVVARDIAEGRAEPLPKAIERDSYGLPIVIWAPAPLAGASTHPACREELSP
ncbi:NUDIX hydrolase [Methylorubrum thiocyanatum]